jgi:hypothetical protein
MFWRIRCVADSFPFSLVVVADSFMFLSIVLLDVAIVLVATVAFGFDVAMSFAAGLLFHSLLLLLLSR